MGGVRPLESPPYFAPSPMGSVTRSGTWGISVALDSLGVDVNKLLVGRDKTRGGHDGRARGTGGYA
jgi:hypothetical protein